MFDNANSCIESGLENVESLKAFIKATHKHWGNNPANKGGNTPTPPHPEGWDSDGLLPDSEIDEIIGNPL